MPQLLQVRQQYLDKTLKISQLQFTNDPKESKELYFFTFTGIIPSESLGGSFNKIHKAAKRIKLREWKVVCFAQNHPDLESGKVPTLDNPFLSGKYRPAMWTHYASSPDRPHDGVCLKFNYQKLNQRISDTFADRQKYFVEKGAVKYDDLKLFRQPPFSLDNILELGDVEIEERAREYFRVNHDEIFLVKSKDWDNENEYRWLVHSRNDAPEYISIDGVLEEVLVGEEFPRVYDPSLSALCATLNVPPKRLHWFNGIPDERPIHPA